MHSKYYCVSSIRIDLQTNLGRFHKASIFYLFFLSTSYLWLGVVGHFTVVRVTSSGVYSSSFIGCTRSESECGGVYLRHTQTARTQTHPLTASNFHKILGSRSIKGWARAESHWGLGRFRSVNHSDRAS